MRFLRSVFILTCLAASAGICADLEMTRRPEFDNDLQRSITLEHEGRIREAELLLLSLIRSAETAGNDSELAIALNNLGVLYATSDRHADAERYFHRSLGVLRTIPGELAVQVQARAKLHLAGVYLETSRYNDALKLDLHSVLEILQTPEDRTRAKGSLAALAGLKKDFATAERMYLDVLAFWMDPSRADRSGTEIATIQNNLGVLALWQNNPELGNTRLEESFATWERTLGPGSPTLAKAMTNVAHSCTQLKQYEAAAKWLGRAKVISQKSIGELHPFTVAVMFSHAEALKKAGQKAEAGEVKRAASEARKMMRSPSIADYTVDYREVMSLQSRKGRP